MGNMGWGVQLHAHPMSVDLAYSHMYSPCELTLHTGSTTCFYYTPHPSPPVGQWRMGTKRLFELLPRSLVKRLKEERRRLWSIQQRTAVSAATQELAAWKVKHGGNKGVVADAVQKEKEELEARLQVCVLWM